MFSITHKLALALLCLPVLAIAQINIDTQTKGSRVPYFGTDSGVANSYAVTTVAPLGPLLKTGSAVIFFAAHANTGASTIAVDGLAAIALKTTALAALTSGLINTGGLVYAVYDGTVFQCVSCSVAGPAGPAGPATPNNRRFMYRARNGAASNSVAIIGDVDQGGEPGGTFTSLAATASAPAAGKFATPATVGSFEDVFGNPNFVAGRNIDYQTYNKIDTLTNSRLWITLSDQSTTTMQASDNPAGNYIGLWYCNDASTACQKNGVSFDATTFWCASKDNTTQAFTDSTITVDTNWHKFEVQFNDSIPNVVISIDGTAVCTMTSHLPTAGALMRRAIVYRTFTATSISLLDAWDQVFSDF